MDNPIIRIHARSFTDEGLTAKINFPINKEQANDVFRRLGIDDKDESEISFEDIECPVDGIFDVVHPDASFKDINRLALALERMSDINRQKLSSTILTPGVVQGTSKAMGIKETIKIAERINEEKAPSDKTTEETTAPKRSKRRDMDAR